MYDLLVLGSGVAGLTTARRAARAGLATLVLTKGELAHSATRYAQGGVAAALEAPDSPDLHLADTLAAGAGLCDPDAVRVLVDEGPDRVLELVALGAVFDPGADPGGLDLAREGGHSLARVVHAGGDATGAEIERALVDAVRAAPVEVREGWFVLDLLLEGDRDGGRERARAAGVVACDPDGRVVEIRAAHTVLATGGAGQCFAVTTNPALSTGDGIALALRAGVACADLEFVQFHPTALHVDARPRPLLSEALRGEGAVLRDTRGEAFMAGEHPLGDLAPRDVVSRAIHRRRRSEGVDHLWLDATDIPDLASRFPTITAACRAAGLDPTRDWLPVAPAAHYVSGGVVADLDGATTLRGLWACGEVACSGVHGANRLASNSLLDGLVFGARVVDAVCAGRDGPSPTGAMRGVEAPAVGPGGESASDRPELPVAADGVDAARDELQAAMTADCGVERDDPGLARAARITAALADRWAAPGAPGPGAARDAWELRNLLTVAAATVEAARARTETRGAHARAEHPDADPALRGRFVVPGPPVLVPLPVPAADAASGAAVGAP